MQIITIWRQFGAIWGAIWILVNKYIPGTMAVRNWKTIDKLLTEKYR